VHKIKLKWIKGRIIITNKDMSINYPTLLIESCPFLCLLVHLNLIKIHQNQKFLIHMLNYFTWTSPPRSQCVDNHKRLLLAYLLSSVSAGYINIMAAVVPLLRGVFFRFAKYYTLCVNFSYFSFINRLIIIFIEDYLLYTLCDLEVSNSLLHIFILLLVGEVGRGYFLSAASCNKGQGGVVDNCSDSGSSGEGEDPNDSDPGSKDYTPQSPIYPPGQTVVKIYTQVKDSKKDILLLPLFFFFSDQ